MIASSFPPKLKVWVLRLLHEELSLLLRLSCLQVCSLCGRNRAELSQHSPGELSLPFVFPVFRWNQKSPGFTLTLTALYNWIVEGEWSR